MDAQPVVIHPKVPSPAGTPQVPPTHLRFIATGGTFDKRYNPMTGSLDFAKESHLRTALPQCRFNANIAVTELPLMDSLDMQDVDRERVLAACRAAPEARLVIVHGTDTMPETAQLLGQAALGKTIVLTGAMVPLDVTGSDALFNLGCASTAAQMLAPGVYVAMGGQLFNWDNVRKDRAVGRFEAQARVTEA